MYDFIQLLNDYSVPFNAAVNEGWVNISCPLCRDNTLHGGFNSFGGYYHCFKCGGQDLTWVFSHLLGLTSRQTEDILTKYSGRSGVAQRINKKTPKAESIELPGGELEPMHRKYLKKRGFDPDFLADKYSILGGGIAGDWCFRIIIPIFYSGKLVSFQGRDITGKAKLRYKTLGIEESVMNPKHTLYNMDNIRGESVVLVEGAFDVWRIGDGCVATLGTTMTEAQVFILSKKCSHIVFLFDPEPEAYKRALSKARSLAFKSINVDIIQLEGGHDPAEADEEEVRKIREEAGI